jgi:hypothetical protein
VLKNYTSDLEWGAPVYLRATKYSDAKFKLYRDGMFGIRGQLVQNDYRNRALNGQWYTEASLVLSWSR